MRGHVPQEFTPPVVDEEFDGDEDLEDESESDEPEKPLPDHVTDCGDTWVYDLQHPLEPAKDDPRGTDFAKVRVTKTIYMRHMIAAHRGGARTEYEAGFALACSMASVPTKLMQRVDVRDYKVIASLVARAQRMQASVRPT